MIERSYEYIKINYDLFKDININENLSKLSHTLTEIFKLKNNEYDVNLNKIRVVLNDNNSNIFFGISSNIVPINNDSISEWIFDIHSDNFLKDNQFDIHIEIDKKLLNTNGIYQLDIIKIIVTEIVELLHSNNLLLEIRDMININFAKDSIKSSFDRDLLYRMMHVMILQYLSNHISVFRFFDHYYNIENKKDDTLNMKYYSKKAKFLTENHCDMLEFDNMYSYDYLVKRDLQSIYNTLKDCNIFKTSYTKNKRTSKNIIDIISKIIFGISSNKYSERGCKIINEFIDKSTSNINKNQYSYILKSYLGNNINESSVSRRRTKSYNAVYKNYDSKLYEYEIRVKNLKDEYEALVFIRDINSIIITLEDYLFDREKVMSTSQKEKLEILISNYRRVREKVSSKNIPKYSYVGLWGLEDYNNYKTNLKDY